MKGVIKSRDLRPKVVDISETSTSESAATPTPEATLRRRQPTPRPLVPSRRPVYEVATSRAKASSVTPGESPARWW